MITQKTLDPFAENRIFASTHYRNSFLVTNTAHYFPNTFAQDEAHYEKTPVGKGSHVLHRKAQPTEWNRKVGIAGRDISDIKAWELSHRGLSDFSFRLLSEGKHQGIVWERSGSGSVLTTALLKKIRESSVSIDDAARACHSAAIPDKHREAMRFMEPLAQDLMKCIEAKVPAQPSDAADELAKAKTKLAQPGTAMSPVKRKCSQDFESEPSMSADKWAKPALPHIEPEDMSEAKRLLVDSQRKLDSRPKGATNDHVSEWLASLKNKAEFKGKYKELVKYVGVVQDIFKSGAFQSPKLASRLSIKKLSTCIAVAQFQTA